MRFIPATSSKIAGFPCRLGSVECGRLQPASAWLRPTVARKADYVHVHEHVHVNVDVDVLVRVRVVVCCGLFANSSPRFLRAFVVRISCYNYRHARLRRTDPDVMYREA
jgi:hypothetical protein